MFRRILPAISEGKLFCFALESLPGHLALRRTQTNHTLASMSSVAAAADAPEEFAALADDAVDDLGSWILRTQHQGKTKSVGGSRDTERRECDTS